MEVLLLRAGPQGDGTTLSEDALRALAARQPRGFVKRGERPPSWLPDLRNVVGAYTGLRYCEERKAVFAYIELLPENCPRCDSGKLKVDEYANAAGTSRRLTCMTCGQTENLDPREYIALCPSCGKPWRSGHFCRIIPGAGMPPPSLQVSISVEIRGDAL